jgi:NitT/TauT family transport system substrate-binding protein
MRARRLLSLALVVGALAALLGTACAIGQTGAQQSKKVRVGYNKTWTTPFMLIAKHEDAFAKEGIEVEWFEFQGPPQALEALAAGSIDAAVAPVPNLVTAVEKGVNVKAVLRQSGWSDPTSTYFVRVDSGIDSVRDLKGKKIGVNNYGGNFDLYLRHMVESSGLDPKQDVQILEVPIAAVFQALDTSQIDAGVVPALFVPRAEGQFPGKFKPLFTYRDIPGVSARPQFNQLVLVMSGNFINNNRATATAFVKVNVDVERWAAANPQVAAGIWAAEANVPALAQMADPFGPSTNGKLDLPAFELDSQLVHKYGYVKNLPPMTALVDETRVDAANAPQ